MGAPSPKERPTYVSFKNDKAVVLLANWYILIADASYESNKVRKCSNRIGSSSDWSARSSRGNLFVANWSTPWDDVVELALSGRRMRLSNRRDSVPIGDTDSVFCLMTHSDSRRPAHTVIMLMPSRVTHTLSPLPSPPGVRSTRAPQSP